MSSMAADNNAANKRTNVLTCRGRNVLEQAQFGSKDFWEGFKLYCFGRYSQCVKSRSRFLASKMGQVVCELQNKETVSWGTLSDENVRDAWVMMEEYASLYREENWKNLRYTYDSRHKIVYMFAEYVYGKERNILPFSVLPFILKSNIHDKSLMEEFDDVKKLSKFEKGCLLLQLVEDEDSGPEQLQRQSQKIVIEGTTVFEDMQGKLNNMRSTLDDLMKSSTKSKSDDREWKGKYSSV